MHEFYGEYNDICYDLLELHPTISEAEVRKMFYNKLEQTDYNNIVELIDKSNNIRDGVKEHYKDKDNIALDVYEEGLIDESDDDI